MEKNIRIINYPTIKKSLTQLSFGGKLLYRKFNLAELDEFITPVEKFFVRNHLPMPRSTENWELKLEGRFGGGVELSMDNIKSFPKITRVCALECTGNKLMTNRKTMRKQLNKIFRYFVIMSWAKMYQMLDPGHWKFMFSLFRSTGILTGDMLGNAEFGGARLFDVLKEYSSFLEGFGKELIFEGADRGYDNPIQRMRKEPHNYARSWEVEELWKYEPILCYEMNGEPLTLEHGGPLRLMIPGVYGGEQVKWLNRIVATNKKFRGFYQVEYYGYKVKGEVVPVHEIRPKAMVLRVVRQKGGIMIYGIVMAGRSPIDRIEIEVEKSDGLWGDVSDHVTFLDDQVDFSWIRWAYELPKGLSGKIKITPRAFCVDGTCQPLEDTKYNFPWGCNTVVSVIIEI